MVDRPASRPSLVGVDIGGTFTDLVSYIPATGERSGDLRVHKLPSTPQDPSQGLLEGIKALHLAEEYLVVHGSTVATNALLERKGAKSVLITTAGFADVLAIGRQDRPKLYDLMQDRPPALIPRERRLEIAERLDYQGKVLQEITTEALEHLLTQVAACNPQSIAICLLYAFRNAAHERQLALALRERFPEIPISLSSEILPQFREYERTSTVAVNAYVQPVMAQYLENLQQSLNNPLRIMQSSGGSISAEIAGREAVRTVLSGPAGGVIGAFHLGKQAGYDQLITLDMGGTSTDVALCAGSIPLTSEAMVAGCPIGVSTVDMHTVGAGGGSIVTLDEGGALRVGPESAGAVPGPACYGVGEHLTVTDANLVLGRIDLDFFLGGRFPLYPERARERFKSLAEQMKMTVEEVALGILRVVNASMERALRTVSLERGYDPRLFSLLPFGGAGPLHACELAMALGIPRVILPRYPGVLSALGMVLAPIVKEYVQTVMIEQGDWSDNSLDQQFVLLEERAKREAEQELRQLPGGQAQVNLKRLYDVRYQGQSYELTIESKARFSETLERFHAQHQQRFGHSHPEQPVQIVSLRVKLEIQPPDVDLPTLPAGEETPDQALLGERPMIFERGTFIARIYDRARLQPGNRIVGPALLVQEDSTCLLSPEWIGQVDSRGNILTEPEHGHKWNHSASTESLSQPDPATLEIFKHLFASAAEEMGATLGRTAYSPNIKERKDYSCACFDAQGRMIAQAAHIPVHLGAMPASVQAAIGSIESFEPGDCVILNDPYMGGTHLPDITLVAPVFIEHDPDGKSGELFGFVASRAHHADVGGISPGSMPLSRELYQEGIIIPPLKLVSRGVVNAQLLTLLYRNVRTPEERRGDMQSQLATVSVGERRLQELIARYGSHQVRYYAGALLDYTARLTRIALRELPAHHVEYCDYLDDDGWGVKSLKIQVRLQIEKETLIVDFTGSAPQSNGNVNAVQAVTTSSVMYVLRCLIGENVPINDGTLEAIRLIIPERSLLNPVAPAAVAAGNVETSQRIVDVMFGALAQLAPLRVPAASQGTMNNLTIGGMLPESGRPFAYYETMGGGMGARPGADGLSGVHVHMSNTRNTPIEVLEMDLPVRVRRYALRYGTGGAGQYRGGDGLCRELEFLGPATVTLLTDRRDHAPYGLRGGFPGAKGLNRLEREGEWRDLPGKATFEVSAGDVVSLCSPGGGGFLP